MGLNATGRQMKFDCQKSVQIFAHANCFAGVSYSLKGVSSRYFSRDFVKTNTLTIHTKESGNYPGVPIQVSIFPQIPKIFV